MNQYFTPPPQTLRTVGDIPPLEYNPRLRYEGSLPPDIHLISRGVRYESAVPVRRIKAREVIDTRPGELVLVETTRRDVTEGAQKTETLVIDDGLGNYHIVAGEVTAEATDKAVSQTAVENTAQVEAQSMTQVLEAEVNAVQKDFAQTDRDTVEVAQPAAVYTGGISQTEYLQQQAAQREAERRASTQISVGGVPVGTAPSQTVSGGSGKGNWTPPPPPQPPAGGKGGYVPPPTQSGGGKGSYTPPNSAGRGNYRP